MPTQNKIFKYLVPVSTLLMITVNTLAVLLPINGLTTKEISDMYKVFFVPAGYVFSIWGLIYLAVTGFTVYQLTPAADKIKNINTIRLWFILGNLVNAIWIIFWHYLHPVKAVVFMLVLLISLIAIYLHLPKKKINLQERLLLGFPFSLYLGWISVATIANISDALYVRKWDGFGIAPEIWAVIMIAVAMLLGIIMLVREKDLVYTGVLIWAFIGIGVNFADVQAIVIAVIVSVLVLLLTAVGVRLKPWNKLLK